MDCVSFFGMVSLDYAPSVTHLTVSFYLLRFFFYKQNKIAIGVRPGPVGLARLTARDGKTSVTGCDF